MPSSAAPSTTTPMANRWPITIGTSDFATALPFFSCMPRATANSHPMPEIRDLLRRCLQKDQQQRLHDVADARIEIEEAGTGLTRPHRTVGRLALAGLTLTMTVMAAAWLSPWRSIPVMQGRFCVAHRSMTASISVKIAVVPPLPNASVNTTPAVNASETQNCLAA